eukprot:TRINITY_DN5595_c1_g1_i7.p1 TRINITY_DN5595_c1_g1~~TRINITY_DN5595_c1_g1_i7.p1  ORF type:complete len:185 (-),score=37.09 TRINITY_DN5595_c1_g1_i7:649-1203(-)
MEDYLQNMKNLRSQMNDFESEASNIALEEEKLKTEVKAIEEDIESAKSETKGLKEEMDRMLKLKGNTCCQIVNKQKKITMLETESSTLSKTLELLQQEKVSSVTKIKEKRVYYAKVMEDMSIKLQEQQVNFSFVITASEFASFIERRLVTFRAFVRTGSIHTSSSRRLTRELWGILQRIAARCI